jgi:hypothetical protein
VEVKNSSRVGTGVGANNLAEVDSGVDFLLSVSCIILLYKHIGHLQLSSNLWEKYLRDEDMLQSHNFFPQNCS